jgi:hypothetical protein
MSPEAGLSARLQIIDTINRFFLAVDTRDYATARSLLTDQVDFDYTRMFGATMPNTADQMIERVRSNHAGLHGIQHLISNHIVEIDGDTANCRSNYIAHHWFPNPQGDATWAVGGRYQHRLIRTGDLWKLQGGVIEVAWTQGNRTIFDLARAGDQSVSINPSNS